MTRIWQSYTKKSISQIIESSQVYSNNRVIECTYPLSNKKMQYISNDCIYNAHDDKMLSKNVLLICIGYPDEKQQQWTDIVNKMKHFFMTCNPPVSIGVPDIAKFTTLKEGKSTLISRAHIIFLELWLSRI